MYQQGSSLASAEADFWFCLHPGCLNGIMGPFDPWIVMRDHPDHSDVKNFASFHHSHLKFLGMVERRELSPPSALEQAVEVLAKELNEKFTQYVGSLKDELIKYSMNNTPEKLNLRPSIVINCMGPW
jgi:hypothetical protein